MTLSGNKTLPHASLHLEGRFKARSQEIQRTIIDIDLWQNQRIPIVLDNDVHLT
jgi:hypothetical protein